MRRRSLLASAALAPAFGAVAAAATNPPSQPMTLSADQARRDIRLLRRAFTDLHAGLYRYRTAEETAAAFDAADAALAAGADIGTLYLLASRLAAGVRCGHTWTNTYNQGPALRAAVFDAADKLPVTLRVVEGRLRITGSAAAGVAVGSELLAIDGRPAATVIAMLLPYQRADGASDGQRLAQLDHARRGGAFDHHWPLLAPPVAGAYRLTLRERDGAAPFDRVVPVTSFAARTLAIAAPAEDERWTLAIEGGVAVLTLPTMAFWDGRFDARAFTAQSFATLREQRVERLVIDLRRCEGGDDGLGHALLQQLISRPYQLPGWRSESAYERVPYVLARHLDTWDFDFFDRTGQVRKGEGRNWLLPPTEPKRLEPVAQPYRGRVTTLVGPVNSSAGFLLAWDLQRAGAAHLVGRPTSGNRRGLNGGQLAWLTLPASGVAVDIPLLAHFSLGAQPDAGVTPDLPVPQRWADAVAGVDADMAAARRWLAS